jgi:hypothetical protein
MKARALSVCVPALVLGLSTLASAAYQISESVIGAGGGATAGANYDLCGTVGQPAVGTMSGTDYRTEIGFWYLPGWVVTAVPDDAALPSVFSLEQNRPNPFNPVTVVRFAVPKPSRVSLRLYDVSGREVRTLVDSELERGFHTVTLDATGLPSGVYFCRMTSGDFADARKLVLLK